MTSFYRKMHWQVCKNINCSSACSAEFVLQPVQNVRTLVYNVKDKWGTGIRGLMRGMATLPQGNQELLVVRDNTKLVRYGILEFNVPLDTV